MNINIDCNTLSEMDFYDKVEYLTQHLESLSLVCGDRAVRFASNRFFNSRGRLIIDRKAFFTLINISKLD